MRLQSALVLVLFMKVVLLAGSGGKLSPEQGAYDVKYYDLNLSIDPTKKIISGSLLITVRVMNLIDTLVLDLNNNFKIDSILLKKNEDALAKVLFIHSGGKIKTALPASLNVNDLITAKIFYSGIPKVSIQPPWDDGFVWKKTPDGKPWIGVACETEGGDIWWPCKDHPSDEPDSMHLSFTVPNPLICVSNGKFLGSADNGNSTSTFRWFVSTPINNYNVTFYAAEYKVIEDNYKSISGKTIPFYFWVLPDKYDQALNHMNVFRTEFDFLESICGPYPFGTDKHGFAHSPYWGMEHQSIIAYGHDFSLNEWGFDYIHLHELAHEWWGNLVTAKDWSDVWIHEGIATYTEALFVEHTKGQTALFQYMDQHRPGNIHMNALAPRNSFEAGAAFFFLNPYNRGASVLHTLRYYVGDQTFFKILKAWAYPDSTDTDNSNGRLCRIVNTDDLKLVAEELSGKNLNNFFEVFFRQKSYPILKIARGVSETSFTWTTENSVPLDLDVPVRVNGTIQVIDMNEGKGRAPIKQSDEIMIDPNGWILMEPDYVTEMNENEPGIKDYKLGQNFPNPFNPVTKIIYEVPATSEVTIRVYDSLCQLVHETKTVAGSGRHNYHFDGSELSSGMYFYYMEADAVDGSDSFSDVKRMLMIK